MVSYLLQTLLLILWPKCMIWLGCCNIKNTRFNFSCSFNSGNRRTCRLTLIPVSAQLPSSGAGALEGRVAWLTELGAALVFFQGAQSLVCVAETEGESCNTCTHRMKKELAFVPHRFHSGPLWNLTCIHSRSLPRCPSTWLHFCRAYLHTGLRLNTDSKPIRKGNVLMKTVRWWKSFLAQHLPT